MLGGPDISSTISEGSEASDISDVSSSISEGGEASDISDSDDGGDEGSKASDFSDSDGSGDTGGDVDGDAGSAKIGVFGRYISIASATIFGSRSSIRGRLQNTTRYSFE